MPVGQKSQRKHGRKKLSERGDTYYLTKSMAVRGFEKLRDEFDKKKNTDLVSLILTYLDGKFTVILRRRTTKKNTTSSVKHYVFFLYFPSIPSIPLD